MTDIIEAMDDAYKRAERKFRNINDQISWLGSFGATGGGNVYEQAALKVAEDLQLTQDIKNNIDEIKTIEKLNQYEQQVDRIELTKIKREAQGRIEDRRRYLESNVEKVFKQTEQEYKQKIKQADSPEEVNKIISEAKKTVGVPQKVLNKLEQEALKQNKELRKEAAKEKEKRDQELSRLREEAKKAEKEAKKETQLQVEKERKAEANRIREEREAEIAREKERQAERDLRLAERKAQEAIDRATEQAIEEALG